MKYLSDPRWKDEEKKGHITKAAKLMLDEIKENCEQFPSIEPQKSSLTDLYRNNYYISLLASVSHDIFLDLKQTRKELKRFIENFRMPE